MTDVRILVNELLSDNWYVLRNYTLEYRRRDGRLEIQHREVYDRGDGAVALLYDKRKRTVILTRQFRLPTLLNGNPDGQLVEACAGLLDGEHPDDCIRREVEEETGYQVKSVRKVMEVYMSPGVMTEILHCYFAEYDASERVGKGGGHPEEKEDIEVLEMPFEEALQWIGDGRIRDAKTILLLQQAALNGLFDVTSNTTAGY
jgi:nudix-type nucleoside diphosphatase (YffH/AdpP family)